MSALDPKPKKPMYSHSCSLIMIMHSRPLTHTHTHTHAPTHEHTKRLSHAEPPLLETMENNFLNNFSVYYHIVIRLSRVPARENYAYAKKIVLSSKLSQLCSNFENELDLRHGKNGVAIANQFLVVLRYAKVNKFTLNTCGTAK